jgi:hypothetical protein
MRHCYICGRQSLRRIVVEPLMLPVCVDRECSRVARGLTELHCTVRPPEGKLCGAPATPHVQVDGLRLCAMHVKLRWQAA